MQRNVLHMIENSMSGFSKGQRRIASYILENYDKAAFMTASKLGSLVGVSESTVVRFAAELGFPGYPAMQKALQEMIRSKLTSIQRIEVTNDRIGDHDILSMVMQYDIEKIRLTMEETDQAQFQRAVDAIIKARHIYILGVRSAAAIASFMGFYFTLIFNNVTIIHTTSSSEVFEQLLHIGPEDVIIGISFPRYSRRTVKAMQFAHDRGAEAIAITDSAASPLAPYSTITLLAKSDMASFVDSLVAPLSLVNALIVAIGRKKNDDLSRTFESLERICDEYEVYEKVDENP